MTMMTTPTIMIYAKSTDVTSSQHMHRKITGVRRKGVTRSGQAGMSPRSPPKIELEDVDTDSDDDDNDGPPDGVTGNPPQLISRRYEDLDSDDDDDNSDDYDICEINGHDAIATQNDYYQSNLAPLGDDRTGDSPRGRVHTRRQQRRFYTADGTGGQRYKYPDENAVIHVCHQGAGYGTKQGFINLAGRIEEAIDETAPPQILTEEDIEEHIFGIILASHYSLKKGTELFGEKANDMTTKELQQIHDMGTCEAQDASKLTKQEKVKR